HVVPVESCGDRLRILRGASVALYTLLSLDLVLTVVAFRDEVDRHSLYQRVKSKPWTVTLAEARAVEHRVDTVNAISLVLLVAIGVGCVVNSMNSRAQTVDAALSASVGFMVRCVAFAAAAVLAIVAVRLVTRQQRELTSVR